MGTSISCVDVEPRASSAPARCAAAFQEFPAKQALQIEAQQSIHSPLSGLLAAP